MIVRVGVRRLVVSTRQVAAARALLGWSREDLAGKAGVGGEAMERLEAAGGGVGGHSDDNARILDVLKAAGVDFIDEDAGTGGGIGVRLRGAGVHEEGRRPEDLDSTNDD